MLLKITSFYDLWQADAGKNVFLWVLPRKVGEIPFPIWKPQCIFQQQINPKAMNKKLFLMLLLSAMLSSCVSLFYTTDKNIRKLELGMTEEEVIQVMGKSYEIIARTEDSFTLGYKSASDEYYRLKFAYDQLVEWDKVWLKDTYNAKTFQHSTCSE